MAFTKTNGKKMGRPPKNMQRDRLRQEFESVIRTGGRVKKAKKVFDPSENTPPRKRGRHGTVVDAERPKANTDSTDNTNNSSNSLQQAKTHKKYKKRKIVPKLQDDFCSICSKKSSNFNIQCQDCNLKVHQLCLKMNFQNSKLLEAKWRCDNCKSCAICYENAETGPLITCSACIKSYHYTCHVPNIYEEININWMCTKCSPKPSQFKPSILKSRRNTICAALAKDVFATTNNELKNDSSDLEENDKNINLESNNNEVIEIKINNSDNKIKFRNSEDYQIDQDSDDEDDDYEYDNDDQNNVIPEKLNQNHRKIIMEGDVPDVSKWSCDQLASFIKKYFPAEARNLREQEIDGASLLLLSRSDVINGLNLKLGPAIRLYNFIIMLQTQKKDITSTWIY